MKKLILLTALLYCSYISNALVSSDTIPRQDLSQRDSGMQYLKTARAQKVAGSIFIGAGFIAGSIALILEIINLKYGLDFTNPRRKPPKTGAADAFAITGAVLVMAGLPLIYLSSKNNKKAKILLSTNIETLPLPMQPKKMFSLGFIVKL